jgi:hypothetical protein
LQQLRTVALFCKIKLFQLSMQGYQMNSKLVIVLVVQFMLGCAPLNRQAAALERDQESVQQCNINQELSQDCLNPRDASRVKDNRLALLLHRGRIRSMPLQSDLLQELLTSEDIRHESNQMTEEIIKLQRSGYKSKEQETGLLEELLVAASIP